jgi:hypothetical protein
MRASHKINMKKNSKTMLNLKIWLFFRLCSVFGVQHSQCSGFSPFGILGTLSNF